MVTIPDTELMAEKLGMIVLCEHCGKRLSRCYVARIPRWKHTDTNLYGCNIFSIANLPPCAKPRSGPLADSYEMEPQ
jgi:hypothetical protein